MRCIELGALDYLPEADQRRDPAARDHRVARRPSGCTTWRSKRRPQAELLRTIERQKDELSRFLSPQVAALVSSPEGEQLLAGHRREATAAFCDLRGFTAFSEAAEPEEVLGRPARVPRARWATLIVEHGGTLEHFAGDGMMVFFNDPVLQDDHELRAVRMAVAMRERFAELASAWATRGYELGFGVGIATGYATLGPHRLRGPLRLRHGRHGGDRRLAPELGRPKPARSCSRPRSHAAVEDLVEVEPVGELQLKGISHPIAAVNVLGLRGASDAVGVDRRPCRPIR